MNGSISKILAPFMTLKFRQNIAEENQQIIRKNRKIESIVGESTICISPR